MILNVNTIFLERVDEMIPFTPYPYYNVLETVV